MFWKLIKHEFRVMLRVLLPTLLSVLGVAILTRVSFWLMEGYDNATTISVIIMLVLTLILGSIAAVILVGIFLIVRFVKSTLSDEGYLTHTLPVGIHSILFSRLLVAFVCMLLTYLTVYVSLFIGLISNISLENIRGILDFFQIDGLSETLLRTLITSLISIFSSLLMFYAAFSVGFSFANHKGGLSVVFIFAFYFGTQIINTVVSVIRIVDTITNLNSGVAFVNDTLLINGGLQLLYSIVYYVLCWLMQKKRLNLA